MSSYRLRTKYLIMPGLQLRMALIAGLIAIFQCLMIQALIWNFSESLRVKMAAAQLGADSPLTIFIERQTATLRQSGWIVGVLTALVSFALWVVVSHRVAGPLYRIKITIQAWRRGEDIRLALRKADLFQDLATELEALKTERFTDTSAPGPNSG